MKCPLLHHKEHNPDVFPGETFEECFKEECAWWDRISCCCQITYLKDIASALVRKKEVKP